MKYNKSWECWCIQTCFFHRSHLCLRCLYLWWYLCPVRTPRGLCSYESWRLRPTCLRKIKIDWLNAETISIRAYPISMFTRKWPLKNPVIFLGGRGKGGRGVLKTSYMLSQWVCVWSCETINLPWKNQRKTKVIKIKFQTYVIIKTRTTTVE